MYHDNGWGWGLYDTVLYHDDDGTEGAALRGPGDRHN